MALCMLIGMPLSVNVGAAEALKVAAAVQVPASIASDSNSSGLDANKSVALYFNKNVAIDLSKTGAVIVQCNAQGKAVNYWKATITANTAYGSSNNYVVTINPDVNQTIGAVVSSAKTHAWANRAVVRLFDKTTGIDNFVGGVTSGSEKLAGATPYAFGGCQTNGNINATTLANNVCDFYEAEITSADSMPKITGAEWTSELGVKVTYSHPVSNAGRVWGGVRLVNSKGQLICWLADTNKYVPLANATGSKIEYLQSRIDPTTAASATQSFTLGQTAGQTFGSFAAGSKKDMSWFKAHLEACQAANPSETFQLAYVIEESSSNAAAGESANNWYMSGMYAADGKPLSVTHSRSTAGKDTIVMPLSDWDKVTVEKVDVTSDTTVEVTFSHPVKLDMNAYYGLRVIDPARGNLVGPDDSNYQLSFSSKVAKSGATYDTVWKFTTDSSITAFVRNKYFFGGKNHYLSLPLCFAIQEAAGAANDGVMQAVTTEDGKALFNPNKTTSGRENFWMSIMGDDFFHMAQADRPTAVLAAESQVLLTTKGVSSTAFGSKVYLRAYNAQGQLLKLDGKDAQWQVPLSKVEPSGQCYLMKGTISANFGTNKYSAIKALLDAEYDEYSLELVVVDGKFNEGLCQNLTNYANFKIMPASELYSNDTEDVGVVAMNQNIASITDVEVLNDMSSADGNKYVIVTFSHDIDMALFEANATGNAAFLFTSAYGLDNWINADGGVGGASPADQAPVQNMVQYGNAGNKVIGKVPFYEYAQMMNALSRLEQNHPSDTYEYTIRMRFEMPAGYEATKFPLNYNIRPLDANILPPYMQSAWADSGKGRIFADVDGTAAPMDMIAEQLSDHTIRVTFGYWQDGVFMPEAVTVNDSVFKPYIGLRMVNAQNILIYGNRDNTGTTLASQSLGRAMQWAAQSYEMLNDTQMLITFPKNVNISDVMDKSNMPAGLVNFEIKIAIEEVVSRNGVDNPGCVSGNGGVHAIVSKNNPNRHLACDMVKTGGHWDGAYASFTPLDPSTPIEVKNGKVKITGENKATFEWTEAVDMGSNYYAGFRYVDPTNGSLLYYDAESDTVTVAASHTDANGKTVDHTPLQFTAVVEYADASKVKMTARLSNAARFEVRDFSDLVNPAADSEWGKIKAKYNGAIKLCLEEKGNSLPGIIDSFAGVDGKAILAQPFIGAWSDGVYIDLTGKPIVGELSMTSVKAVSDSKIVVSFSAPVKVLDSAPFAAVRAYNEKNVLLYYNTLTKEYTTNSKQVNADGQPMYKDADGNPTTEATSADGTVKYARIDNVVLQWNGTWSYNNDEHTELAFVIAGRNGAPTKRFLDVLTFDWSSVGAYVMFTLEDNGADMVIRDNHINNIVRADNRAIALDGNFFPYDRDNCRGAIEMAFTPAQITSSVQVLSDLQMRVKFSMPVNVDPNTYMAVRMLDKDMNLMWNADRTVPYQWGGTWKYESDAKTSIIWTFNTPYSIWGAETLYELLNWKDALEQFKGEGNFYFIIEEKDTKDLKVGRLNNFVETVASLDGANHLQGEVGTGYDGAAMAIDAKILSGDLLELESVTAIDEKTMKVKFTREVAFKEGDEAVSMAIRYLTPSGDSEVLTDGKTAIFKGDWKYDANDKSTVIWTLNSKHTDSLTEIFTFGGKFEWNKGARCAFVIMDQEKEYYSPAKSMRINGVTDITGVHHLVANYATKDFIMTQMDVTIDYELPTVTVEPEQQIEYFTDYKTYIYAAAGIGVILLIAALVVALSKKKAR